MKYLSLLISVFFLQPSFAQTKAIAYKSHSGAPENYTKALSTNKFHGAEAGFGLPSHRTYRFIKTVEYLSPGKAVIVTAYYQGDFMDTIPTDFIRNVSDTLMNDPLFNNPHVLDSIKKVMKERYRYGHKIEEAKYIGFDNKVPKQKKQKKESEILIVHTSQNIHASPPVIIPVQTSQGLPELPVIDLKFLCYLVSISFAAGWLSWKLYKPLYRQSI